MMTRQHHNITLSLSFPEVPNRKRHKGVDLPPLNMTKEVDVAGMVVAAE